MLHYLCTDVVGDSSMIRLRVQEVAQRQGITTITELAAQANLAYDTAADFWHGRMKRVDLAVLDRLCKALHCRVEDVFEQTNDRRAARIAGSQPHTIRAAWAEGVVGVGALPTLPC